MRVSKNSSKTYASTERDDGAGWVFVLIVETTDKHKVFPCVFDSGVNIDDTMKQVSSGN